MSIEITDLDQHMKALELAFESALSQRPNGSSAEFADAMTVVMDDGRLLDEVHGRRPPGRSSRAIFTVSGVGNRQAFVREFKAFDGDFVAVRIHVCDADLSGPRVGQGPHHCRIAALIAKLDGNGHALYRV